MQIYHQSLKSGYKTSRRLGYCIYFESQKLLTLFQFGVLSRFSFNWNDKFGLKRQTRQVKTSFKDGLASGKLIRFWIFEICHEHRDVMMSTQSNLKKLFCLKGVETPTFSSPLTPFSYPQVAVV